ncbi:VTT domain-containing protein [Neptunomonas sp.]|uniref:YqaA family protein n=1 Tax=Neptunomonas sp. TaxID=1971898 RepID=UPI0025D887A5|nr:VTT domain-containing protein [Neptunomonas sp.]
MNADLWGLFLSSLVSSTLLPGGSEAYLAWLVSDGDISPWVLIGVATVGNTLGGVITYAMGRLVAIRYPFKLLDKGKYQRAKRWFDKVGCSILLLSWLPVVGDPLCFVAGWMRVNAFIGIICIALGKAVRYMLITSLFN